MSLDLNFAPVFASSDALLAGTLVTIEITLCALLLSCLLGLLMGMSSKQAMIKIILPQAIVRMLPPLGNEFIALIKNSALVSLITIHDVMQQGNTIISNTYRDLETYLVIAVIYFVLTSLTVTALRHYEKRHHQKGVQ